MRTRHERTTGHIVDQPSGSVRGLVAACACPGISDAIWWPEKSELRLTGAVSALKQIEREALPSRRPGLVSYHPSFGPSLRVLVDPGREYLQVGDACFQSSSSGASTAPHRLKLTLLKLALLIVVCSSIALSAIHRSAATLSRGRIGFRRAYRPK